MQPELERLYGKIHLLKSLCHHAEAGGTRTPSRRHAIF
jgi:hypothetical protein